MAKRRPIKGILWDIGLVMFFWDTGKDWLDFYRLVPRLQPICDQRDHCDCNELITAIRAVQRRLETGEIKENQHRLELSAVFGLTEPLSWQEYRFILLEAPNFQLNQPLIEVQEDIARLGIPQGLVSNLCPMMHAMLDKAHALRSLTAAQRFSYTNGMVKPDEDIFVRGIDDLALPAEDVFYVDDNEGNIAVAGKDKLGCQAHLYKSNVGLGLELMRGGLPKHVVAPLLRRGRYVPLPTDWEPPTD
jgi:FMN phosphatase YigB (HAD superfamily)